MASQKPYRKRRMLLFRKRVNAQVAERGDAKQRIAAYEEALRFNRELKKSLPGAAAAFREIYGAGRQRAIEESMSEG